MKEKINALASRLVNGNSGGLSARLREIFLIFITVVVTALVTNMVNAARLETVEDKLLVSISTNTANITQNTTALTEVTAKYEATLQATNKQLDAVSKELAELRRLMVELLREGG